MRGLFYDVRMSIPVESGSGVFGWHDLAGTEVYHIAHLENQARVMVATYLGRITTGWDETQTGELANAQRVRDNYEQYAESWLQDIAAFRGLSISPQTEIPVPHKKTLIRTREGEGLKRRREAAGFSQRDLAEATGISQSTLCRAEKGIPIHPDTKLELLKFLSSL